MQYPADTDFWAWLHWIASAHRATFLEGTFTANVSRWHRLTRDNIKTVRSQLATRAKLPIWPELLTDVDTAMAALPDEGLVEVVWENERVGRLRALSWTKPSDTGPFTNETAVTSHHSRSQ